MTETNVADATAASPEQPWRILVVDDEPDVHTITELALKRRRWKGRRFAVENAYSAHEGRALLADNGERFHIAIIDVVMETDRAGLELCEYIRATFSPALRIILRTGQPGVAPKDEILDNFDIDHYLAKTEATVQRLFSLIRACLRAAEYLRALDGAHNRLARESEVRGHLVGDGPAKPGFIAQILNQAEALKDAAPADVPRLADSIAATATQMNEVFQPPNFRLEAAAAVGKRRVLALLARRRALRLSHGGVAGMNATTTSELEWDEALACLSRGEVDVLFCDWENSAAVTKVVRAGALPRVVLLATQSVFERTGDNIVDWPLARGVMVTALVDEDAAPDSFLVPAMLAASTKLLSSDLFGIEKQLAPGSAIREEVLNSSQARGAVLDDVERATSVLNTRRRAQRNIVALLGTLIDDAMFDAPVNAAGEPKYAHLDRSEPLELEPGEAVTVRYGSDDDGLVVSVTDRFGRLVGDDAAYFLIRCIASDETRLNSDDYSAARNLQAAFQSAARFIVNVHPGRRTEVICRFERTGEPDELATRPRSFHYFRTSRAG